MILIGATTENPYFEVNGALLSRSKIFHLEPLSAEEIAGLIRKAVTDEERGMGAYGAPSRRRPFLLSPGWREETPERP